MSQNKRMTPEILDLLEERTKAKADEQKYRKLDKQEKRGAMKQRSIGSTHSVRK